MIQYFVPHSIARCACVFVYACVSDCFQKCTTSGGCTKQILTELEFYPFYGTECMDFWQFLPSYMVLHKLRFFTFLSSATVYYLLRALLIGSLPSSFSVYYEH